MEVLHVTGNKRPEKLVQVVGKHIDVISDIKEVTIKDKRTKEEKHVFRYVRTRYSTEEFLVSLKSANDNEKRIETLEAAFGELADIILSGGNE